MASRRLCTRHRRNKQEPQLCSTAASRLATLRSSPLIRGPLPPHPSTTARDKAASAWCGAGRARWGAWRAVNAASCRPNGLMGSCVLGRKACRAGETRPAAQTAEPRPQQAMRPRLPGLPLPAGARVLRARVWLTPTVRARASSSRSRLASARSLRAASWRAWRSSTKSAPVCSRSPGIVCIACLPGVPARLEPSAPSRYWPSRKQWRVGGSARRGDRRAGAVLVRNSGRRNRRAPAAFAGTHSRCARRTFPLPPLPPLAGWAMAMSRALNRLAGISTGVGIVGAALGASLYTGEALQLPPCSPPPPARHQRARAPGPLSGAGPP